MLLVYTLFIPEKLKTPQLQIVKGFILCPEQAQTPKIKGKQKNLTAQYISVLACGVFSLCGIK